MISIPASISQTTMYAGPQTMKEEAIPYSLTYKPSSSWRKFIPRSKQRSQADPTMTAIPATKTTTEGPTILKPASTTEELLSGPLFQVAGMFEINEPGWADKHDEYLAETYL
jgi:hypothetical protein